MIASAHKHANLVVWLVKAGASPQTPLPGISGAVLTCNAAEISRGAKATTEQIAYLDAKMHCSSLGCSGAGLMKCTECKQARYCGQQCLVAHWKAHKADCKRWSVELQEAMRKGSTLRDTEVGTALSKLLLESLDLLMGLAALCVYKMQ
jgi:hypothetical protein